MQHRTAAALLQTRILGLKQHYFNIIMKCSGSEVGKSCRSQTFVVVVIYLFILPISPCCLTAPGFTLRLPCGCVLKAGSPRNAHRAEQLSGAMSLFIRNTQAEPRDKAASFSPFTPPLSVYTVNRTCKLQRRVANATENSPNTASLFAGGLII